MNKILLFGFLAMMPLLTSCSSRPVQSEDIEQAAGLEEEEESVDVSEAMAAPDLYLQKDGRTLKLVRVLEGGSCQNEDQGAVGMFLLYADMDDVERIKKTRGAKAFAEFEQVIEEFAMAALQQAIDELDFSADPFALDEEDMQGKLAERLASLFRVAVADAVADFEAQNGMKIELTPLMDSLYFYLDGCEMPHED